MTHIIGKIRTRKRQRVVRASLLSNAVRRAIRPAGLQAKLKIGAPDDAFEREADRVASHVMGKRAGPAPAIQRRCAECEDEQQNAKVQRQADDAAKEEEEEVQAKQGSGESMHEEEEEEVQAKRGPGAASTSANLTQRVRGFEGSGAPLSPAVRAFYEPRFGADFTDVRVHTGETAQTTAKALNARAFTHGRNIVFNEGEYAPATSQGGTLLAHELTHVLQQRGQAGAPQQLQRWQIGPAPAPAIFQPVPQDPKGEDHRARLAEAEKLVAAAVKSPRCTNYFSGKCSSGEGDAALKNAFEQARIYYLGDDKDNLGMQDGNSRNIAYSAETYRVGRFFLASTLLHEMFHTCDPSRDASDEIDAENALEQCGLFTPYIMLITPDKAKAGDEIAIEGVGIGSAQGKGDRVTVGGQIAAIKSWGYEDDTGIATVRVTVPAGTKSGDVVVINNNVRSNASSITIEP